MSESLFLETYTAFYLITYHLTTTLLATRGLLPVGRPRANGRWLARCAHATLRGSPTTAGREGGSADRTPAVPPVVALLLAPGAQPPHAVRPPFHNEGRNPA